MLFSWCREVGERDRERIEERDREGKERRVSQRPIETKKDSAGCYRKKEGGTGEIQRSWSHYHAKHTKYIIYIDEHTRGHTCIHIRAHIQASMHT